MKVGIFHTAFVGDLALLGLLIEGLSRARHTVLLFTNSAGIELYRDDPRVQTCVLVSKGKGIDKARSVFENSKKISKEHLDALLVPHRSATSSLTAKLAGVKKTIGHRDAALARLYTETMPRNLSLHEAFRVFEMAPDWLISPGIKSDLRSFGRPILRSRPELTALLARFPQALDAPYLVVAPGSVWGTKIYPPEKFALVSSHLMEKDPTLKCIISGSPADKDAINSFLEAIPKEISASRIINTMGCIPLAELITIIAKAKVVLTNDSAPVHIASGTNTPTVAVFGPTVREAGFWPLSERSRLVNYAVEYGAPLPCQPCGIHGPKECPLKHHRCMKDLSVSTVETAVLSVM